MHRLTYALNLVLITGSITLAPALENDKIPALEDRVEETELKNGLKIVVVERHNAPVFFSLISFNVGSAIEVLNKSGLSHFMEHMLFKGSETLGTTDYKKEIPIMAKIEDVATDMKNLRVEIGHWRFDMFEEFSNKQKQEIPPEISEEIGADEIATLKALQDRLPDRWEDLPQEWLSKPWIVADDDLNYWDLFLEHIDRRIELAELLKKQRDYIVQSALDGVYEVHGGQMFNAGTSYDGTTYMVGLPSNCLEMWMSLEADRFQNPVFREYYKEREVVQEELRMRSSSPWGALYKALTQTAFVAHPYGRPIIGWISDIKLTLRSDMQEHFERFYGPNNCQITLVGDLDAKRVFKLAKRYFGAWEQGQIPDEVLVIEPEQKGERRIEVEFDAEPQLMMGYHVPAAPHPDHYALQMIDQVLSYGRTSRFHKTIFEEKGLTISSPGSFTGPGDRYSSIFTVSAAPKAPHSVGEVEQAIYEELEKLKVEPVTNRELERARNRYKVWQLDRLRNNRWLAFTLAGAFVDRGDWRGVTEDYKRLMSVTPEEMQAVANKYFTKKNRTVATLVKPAEEVTADAETQGEIHQ